MPKRKWYRVQNDEPCTELVRGGRQWRAKRTKN